MARPISLLFPLLCLATAAHADVLVVDGGGGGDFTTLTAAVAAALDGDVCLVRDGFYAEGSAVVIDDKALSIVGDNPGLAFVQPGLIVRNIAATDRVVLQNLVLFGGPGTAIAAATPALTLENNAGHVRLQFCEVRGGGGAANANRDGAPALTAVSTASVALVETIVEGGPGQFSPSVLVQTGHGGAAVEWLSAGDLSAHGGSILGGLGGSNEIGAWPDGGDGGIGLDARSGSFYLIGTPVEGGSGGTAQTGGDGGTGIAVDSGVGGLLMGGSFSTGGQGGFSDDGPDGSGGAGIDDPFGGLTDLGGVYHGFSVTSPLREAELGNLSFGGHLGDPVLLVVAIGSDSLPLPGLQGVLLLAAPVIATLAFPSAGNTSLPIVGPGLGAGVESFDLHLQPIFVDGLDVILGTGAVFTVIDDSF
jgi:hypothetical protein